MGCESKAILSRPFESENVPKIKYPKQSFYCLGGLKNETSGARHD